LFFWMICVFTGWSSAFLFITVFTQFFAFIVLATARSLNMRYQGQEIFTVVTR
jgi:hypothetical protein